MTIDEDRAVSPRIPPLEPPYEAHVQAMLEKWMPPGSGVEPLKLFRTLGVHPELAARMRPLGAGVLGHGLVAPRDREIVILRTCARAGAEYEWGVHALAFGKPLGLTDEQITSTAWGDAEDGGWSPREALLVQLADELHDGATISDRVWAGLSAGWSAAQIMELLVIAGWYRLLAYVINGARVPFEPWAARFPARPPRGTMGA